MKSARRIALETAAAKRRVKRETSSRRRESGESTYPGAVCNGLTPAHAYTEHRELVALLKGHPELRALNTPSAWLMQLYKLGWDPGGCKDIVAEWYLAWRCVDETLERQLALL